MDNSAAARGSGKPSPARQHLVQRGRQRHPGEHRQHIDHLNRRVPRRYQSGERNAFVVHVLPCYAGKPAQEVRGYTGELRVSSMGVNVAIIVGITYTCSSNIHP